MLLVFVIKKETGKTTSAINIATFIALANKKILLIDMDPQGNTTTGLGIELEEGVPTVYEILTGKIDTIEVVKHTNIENLFIIPSSLNLAGAEVEFIGLKDREYRLKEAIKKIKNSFDFIFIDAPPSLGVLTINTLTAVESVIVPVQCEYYALEGLSHIVNIIKLIRSRLNPILNIEGILFTMADFRTRLTLQVISEVKKMFPDKVFTTIIPRNIKLAEAPSFGKPIFYYDAFCTGARAYRSVAEEIIKEKIKGVYA